MKIRSLLLLAILPLALIATPNHSSAEIPQADLEAALAKLLKTEKGQEMVGQAIQAYSMKLRKMAKKDEDEKEAAALEQQFKNPVKVDLGKSPVRGPADAKITVVEFSDFQCPYCSKGTDTMDELMKAYPKDVKVVFKNLPLDFHANAIPAAKAALAAGEQGKFWEMHDALFKNQKDLGEDLYVKTAKELGLNTEKFNADRNSNKYDQQIEADSKQAQSIGIMGTPGFVVNGVLVKGAYPIEHFKMIVDRWLKAPAAKG